MHIHTASENTRDSSNKTPSLGLNIQHLITQPPGGKSPGVLNKDTSTLDIYDSLENIRYQLKRTGTQVASLGDTNALSWSLDRGDINQIWRLLRARFQQHHIQSHDQSLGSISSTFYDDQDEKGLKEFSSNKLDGLRKEYRQKQSYFLTVRKRVYGNKHIEYVSSIPALPLPGPALGGGEVTMYIIILPRGYFNLFTGLTSFIAPLKALLLMKLLSIASMWSIVQWEGWLYAVSKEVPLNMLEHCTSVNLLSTTLAQPKKRQNANI